MILPGLAPSWPRDLWSVDPGYALAPYLRAAFAPAQSLDNLVGGGSISNSSGVNIGSSPAGAHSGPTHCLQGNSGNGVTSVATFALPDSIPGYPFFVLLTGWFNNSWDEATLRFYGTGSGGVQMGLSGGVGGGNNKVVVANAPQDSWNNNNLDLAAGQTYGGKLLSLAAYFVSVTEAYGIVDGLVSQCGTTDTSYGTGNHNNITTFNLGVGNNNGAASGTVFAAVGTGAVGLDALRDWTLRPEQILMLPRAAWVPVSASGGTQTLASNIQGSAAVTAALQKGVSLDAAVLGVATAGGNLSLSVPLAAAAAGVTTVNGQLALSVNLAAAAVGQVTAAAGMAVAKALNVAVQGQAALSGDLAVSSGMAANAQGQAAATASLSVTKPLGANAQGQATQAADLNLGKPLGANVQGQASATGNLSNTSGLSASAQGQATFNATLSLVVNLSAAALGQATAAAGLGVSKPLAANAQGQATATADLSVTPNGNVSLAANAQGQATAGATLWLQVPLTSAVLGQASTGAGLSLTIPLTAALLGQASSTAAMTAAKPLAATVQGAAAVGATLSTGAAEGLINPRFIATASKRNWDVAVNARTFEAVA